MKQFDIHVAEPHTFPDSYKSYQEVRVGNSTFINCEAIISIENVFPFLFSDYETPIVWLATWDSNRSKWLYVVKENRPMDPLIQLDARPRGSGRCGFRVYGLRKLLIDAISPRDHFLRVRALDLRPIGLNVYLNENGSLFVGNKKFSEIRVENAMTAIALS